MSLLHSLLALAALLAAAAAILPPPPPPPRLPKNCIEKDIGDTSGEPVTLQPVYIPRPGGLLEIPVNNVCPDGRPPRGVRVIACNTNEGGAPPQIDDPAYGITPVPVICPWCDPGMNVYTTAYCALWERHN